MKQALRHIALFVLTVLGMVLGVIAGTVALVSLITEFAARATAAGGDSSPGASASTRSPLDSAPSWRSCWPESRLPPLEAPDELVPRGAACRPGRRAHRRP